MTIQNVLNSIPEKPLGYIRMVCTTSVSTTTSCIRCKKGW